MYTRIKEFLRGILPAIFVSVGVCFMLCIYAPMELHLGNQHEFWFKIEDIMPLAWAMFIIFTVLCICVFALLKKLSVNAYRIAVAAVFGAMICMYVEGNFLVKNLPPLDGTKVDFGAYPMERLKCIVLWVVVAAVLFVLWKKLGSEKLVKLSGYVALGLFGMLALTSLTLRLTTPLKDSTSYDLAFTEKDKYTMSMDQNLIIFSLDATSEDAFERVLEKYPEYLEDFSDFTSFDNTLCAYPFTSRALPFTLTGEWFENEEPFQEYQNRSFGESKLLNRLWDEDYSVGIYLPDYQLSANLYEGRTANGVRQYPHFRSLYLKAKMIIKMAGLKYAPWDVKYFSYDIPDFNKYTRVVDEQEYDYYDFDSWPLYTQLSSENPLSTTDRKCFKYIHFEGSHVPFSLNNAMERIEDGTYDEKVASALHITSLYLQRLKEAGVYDNSAIIITTDHGYGDKEGDEHWNYANRRVHGLMLVKGIGETHSEMQTDSAPISFEDLQEAYQRLLDGKNSSEIFDWKEGDYRERRCILYYYLDENYMREFIATGNAGDVDSICETGVKYDYNP